MNHSDCYFVIIFFLKISDIFKMMNKDDVKIDRAPKYPGKWTRNNKSGSTLSRCEYLESEAKKWVDKVKDLDKYNTTSTTAKLDFGK